MDTEYSHILARTHLLRRLNPEEGSGTLIPVEYCSDILFIKRIKKILKVKVSFHFSYNWQVLLSYNEQIFNGHGTDSISCWVISFNIYRLPDLILMYKTTLVWVLSRLLSGWKSLKRQHLNCYVLNNTSGQYRGQKIISPLPSFFVFFIAFPGSV